ncbi:MAG: DUF2278 family protein [Acidobacteria bacterium]|nr:DUF2278 family protein [Acidobacteriota bacterium]
MIRYSVLRGKVVDHRREDDDPQSPHFTIFVEADGRRIRCPVNVRSTDKSEVWFKFVEDLRHPVVDELRLMDEGIVRDPERRLRLDFIREPLFDRLTMRQLPFTGPLPQDDLQDRIAVFAEQARVNREADLFVFGEVFGGGGGQGVHDIHMNQGNNQQHRSSDGVFQDGALIFRFPSTGWLGFFTAFNSQVWATDNDGHRLQGFAEGPLARFDEPAPDAGRAEPMAEVAIVAALLNPDGPDQGKETVTLMNFTTREVRLAGWKLLDRQDKAESLQGRMLDAGGSLIVRLRGDGAQLSNNGGSIRLVDASGAVVDSVTYSKSDAVSGRLMRF